MESIIFLENGLDTVAEAFPAAGLQSPLFFPQAGVGEPWRNPKGTTAGLKLPGEPGSALFLCGRCRSTFEVAWALHQEGLMGPWGAALAFSQSNGRGQLGRLWHSPPGNLYVSFFLPDDKLFSGSAGALFTTYMIFQALEAFGLPLMIKWPNDLLLAIPEGRYAGKVGGLLLEERAGAVLAGLGLNLVSAPGVKELRPGSALGAADLRSWGFAPVPLWLRLLAGMRLIYKKRVKDRQTTELLQELEQRLAWRGEPVRAGEDDKPVEGRLLGLAADGSLRILGPDGSEHLVFSGSVSPLYASSGLSSEQRG